MTNQKDSEKAMLENISNASKQFYSAGASFSTIACAAIVLFCWGELGNLDAQFKSNLYGLLFSFLIVLAYALVIPEPKGYPDEGKFRITLAELIFGIINSFVVYSTALALKAF